jgi:glycosyltransferase involved in cell wall biosynthesis
VAATPVARRLGIPVIWRAGGTEAGRLSRLILSVWAEWNPPDLLICCGDAVHRMFSPLVPAPAVVVHNGVDTQRFDPDAAGGTLGGGPFRPAGAGLVVGFAGRLCPQKRPEDIIRLAARLCPQHPDLTFLVAGDGSRRPDYEQKVRALGLDQRVRFLGYVADMRSFYASCDVVVLPSRSEGCPNVVLESMAMRRALVVSSAAGTREVVNDESEALIFPIGDVDALARAVTRVIEQPALRAALADRAQRRARTLFSTDASARRLGNLLRAAMSINPGPGRERPTPVAPSAGARSPATPRLLGRRLAGDGRP